MTARFAYLRLAAEFELRRKEDRNNLILARHRYTLDGEKVPGVTTIDSWSKK